MTSYKSTKGHFCVREPGNTYIPSIIDTHLVKPQKKFWRFMGTGRSLVVVKSFQFNGLFSMIAKVCIIIKMIYI